jgi:hypothetical protein
MEKYTCSSSHEKILNHTGSHAAVAVTIGSGVPGRNQTTLKGSSSKGVENCLSMEGQTGLQLTRLSRVLGRRSLQSHQQQRQKGVAKTDAQAAQPRCRRPDAQAALRIVGRLCPVEARSRSVGAAKDQGCGNERCDKISPAISGAFLGEGKLWRRGEESKTEAARQQVSKSMSHSVPKDKNVR